MSVRKNGDVKRDGDRPHEPQAPEFQPGDIVAITQSALRAKTRMTPKSLYQIGAPNEFLVLGTMETKKDGPCVRLFPCCYVEDPKGGPVPLNEGWPHRETNMRHQGHKSGYFEKIDFRRPPREGDKSSSLLLPFIGELLGFEYREDEQKPEFVARVLGKEGTVSGALAKLLKRIAEANNLM